VGEVPPSLPSASGDVCRGIFGTNLWGVASGTVLTVGVNGWIGLGFQGRLFGVGRGSIFDMPLSRGGAGNIRLSRIFTYSLNDVYLMLYVCQPVHFSRVDPSEDRLR
jgi:hypothetical protein